MKGSDLITNAKKKSSILMVFTIMKNGGWSHVRNYSWIIQKWGRHYLIEITRKANPEISNIIKIIHLVLLVNSFCFDSCFNKTPSDHQFGFPQSLILLVGV